MKSATDVLVIGTGIAGCAAALAAARDGAEVTVATRAREVTDLIMGEVRGLLADVRAEDAPVEFYRRGA